MNGVFTESSYDPMQPVKYTHPKTPSRLRRDPVWVIIKEEDEKQEEEKEEDKEIEEETG